MDKRWQTYEIAPPLKNVHCSHLFLRPWAFHQAGLQNLVPAMKTLDASARPSQNCGNFFPLLCAVHCNSFSKYIVFRLRPFAGSFSLRPRLSWLWRFLLWNLPFHFYHRLVNNVRCIAGCDCCRIMVIRHWRRHRIRNWVCSGYWRYCLGGYIYRSMLWHQICWVILIIRLLQRHGGWHRCGCRFARNWSYRSRHPVDSFSQRSNVRGHTIYSACLCIRANSYRRSL